MTRFPIPRTRSHAPAWERIDLADAPRRHNFFFFFFFPLLLGCPSPETRCHDQANIDACHTLCADSPPSCYRDLATSSPALATELLTHACDERDALACVDLATGQSGPARIDLLDRACTLDSAEGCRLLSEAHLATEPRGWFDATAATVRQCHLMGLRGCPDADILEAAHLHEAFCTTDPRLPDPSCTELDPAGSYGPPDKALYDGILARLEADCEVREPGACALGARWADAGFARIKAPSPPQMMWFKERE